MKTFAPGKDAPLEQTISTIDFLLKQLGFEIEKVGWKNPIPNVWSVIIRDKNQKHLFANGKGTCKKAALASAMGEFVERLATGYFYSDYYLGNKKFYLQDDKFLPFNSKKILTNKLWKFYDPDNELKPENLIDINSANIKNRIRCLPFVSLLTNKKVFFPINLLDNLYASNGMAVGNTRSEAVSQALSEIIERYVKFKIISEEICLPDIPKKYYNKNPIITRAIKIIKNAGYELLLKDASLGGEFPVVNITLLNPKEGSCLAAFGAHPQFQIAMERTLTELLQGRSLKDFSGLEEPSFDSGAVADYINLENHFIDSTGIISWKFFNKFSDYDFQYWNFDDTTENEVVFLKKIINDLGFDIFIYQFDFFGIYVCRIVVPGMSEIYPIDDLIYNNKNEGIFFRKDILNYNKLSVGNLKKLLDKLDAENLNVQRNLTEFLGIPPNHKSELADLTIGELKLMLALKIKDYERALDYFHTGLSLEQFDEKKRKKYKTLKINLNMEVLTDYNIADYEWILKKIH